MAVFSNALIEAINLISCPPEIELKSVQEFEKNLPSWVALTATTHVLDFKKVTILSDQFYPVLSNFKANLESKKANIISINMSKPIQDQINKAGVGKTFSFLQGFADASAQVDRISSNNPDFKKRVIKYLVSASRAAMYTLFKTTVSADENYILKSEQFDSKNTFCISTVNIKSSDFNLKLRLYFEKDCLIQLTRLFVTLNTADIDLEILESTATELLNLIYGGAKSKFNNDNNYDFPPAIPVIISKDKVALEKSTASKNLLIIPFATPVGTYHLEVEMQTI
jgi:CheY-specific phosphatase CheX/anti-anti-sigma regulatory factor